MKIFTNDRGEAPMVLLNEQELRIIESVLTAAVREWDKKSRPPPSFFPMRNLQEEVVDALNYF